MGVPNENNAFRVFLREQLKQSGLTVEQFAVAAGISRSRAYRLASGDMADKLDPEVTFALARYFSLSVEDLLDLYSGRTSAADVVTDEREALVRRFALTHRDLSPDELRDVLQVASAAAKAIKRR